MKIAKTTMTFTFLHPAEDNVDQMSAEAIFDECEQGCFVGSWAVVPMNTVPVPDEKVEAELQALGNYGEFFKAFED